MSFANVILHFALHHGGNREVIHSSFCVFCFQFYRCFLILFHCKHRAQENGQSSMPSKTTVIQLNRRALGNAQANAAAAPTAPNPHECSTPESEKTYPPEETTIPPSP